MKASKGSELSRLDARRSIVVLSLVVALSGCRGTENGGGASSPSANQGRELYQARCAYCHGATGKGDTSMAGGNPVANLADGTWTWGGSVQQIERTISEGVPDTAMRSFKNVMSPAEIAQVATYVKTLESPPR